MLVLSRKVDQCVDIGDEIQIRVLEVRGSRVKLAIDAPRSVSIRRSELPVKVSCEPDQALHVELQREEVFPAATGTALSSYVVEATV